MSYLSSDSRRFASLIFTLFLGFAGYLWFTDSILFPADYLSWYYPFRSHPDFENLSPFLANRGYQDVVFFFLPACMFLGEALSQGQIPLWNPIEGAGLPTGALHGMGFYFPLHWVTYPFFSPLTALHLELSLQFFCGATFSFLLFRRWSQSERGAALGALAWTLGGWLCSFFQQPASSWPLVLLPLIFFALDDIEEERRRGPILAALGVALTVVVGHLQMIVASALVIGGALIFRRQKRKLPMLVALVAGVLLASPHIWSLSELVLLSNRSTLTGEQIANALLTPREYIGLIFANFMGNPGDGFYLGRSLANHVVDSREHCLYVGQITLFLAVLAAVRLKDRTTRCLWGLILVGLVLAGSPALYLLLTKLCPPLSFLTPLRFLPYMLFAVCYLATLGWRSLEERALSRKESLSFLGLIGLFVGSAATFFIPASQNSPDLARWLMGLAQKSGITKPPYFEGEFGLVILERVSSHFSLSSPAVWGPLALITCTVVAIALARTPRVRYLLLMAILTIDLSAYFLSMNVPVPRELFYPKVAELEALKPGRQLVSDGSGMPSRVMGLGRGLHPNILLAYGIATIESYESLLPGDFRALFQKLNGEQALAHQLATATTQENLHPGILDLMGVSLTYDHPHSSEEQNLSSNLAVGSPRKTALRAFLSTSWKTTTDFSAMLEADFEPREAVLLEEAPEFESSGDVFQTLQPEYYGYNRVEFQVSSPQPCLLVLTDFYYPGWQARVNGKRVPIKKAYGFVRAIELPSGNCEVVFSFRPRGVGWFLALSGLGLLILLLQTVFLWKSRLGRPDRS